MNEVNRSQGLSDNWATGLEIAGTIAVIVGVAAIFFSSRAAHYLRVDPQYVSYAAMGLAGAGFTTVCLASFFRREDTLIVDASGRILMNSEAFSAAETAFSSSPARALTAAEAEVYYPRPSAENYREMTTYTREKHPIGMVGPLCSIESAFPDQAQALRHYVYQPIRAEGDCCFIALISGLLHRMLVDEAYKDKILEIEGMHDQISHIHNCETLVAFLNDDEAMKGFVRYMRLLAFEKCEYASERIREDFVYAELDEVASVLVDLFGFDLYITPQAPGFETRTNREMAQFYHGNCYDGRTGRRVSHGYRLEPIAILYRNDHFDLMMHKDLIDRI